MNTNDSKVLREFLTKPTVAIPPAVQSVLMSIDEAYSKFTALDSYFVRCQSMGQGINTKKSVQFAIAADRITELGQGETKSEYHNCTAAEYVQSHQMQLDAIKKARLLYQQH